MFAVTSMVVRLVTVVAFPIFGMGIMLTEPDTPDASTGKVLVEFHP